MSEKSVIQNLIENDKDKDKPWFVDFKMYMAFSMLIQKPAFIRDDMIQAFYMCSKKDFLDEHWKDGKLYVREI